MSVALAVDVGTQSVKAAVLGHDGLAPIATAPLAVSAPARGAVEQDPRWFTDALAVAVPAALDLAGVAGRDVARISVSSQLDAVVLHDRDGRTFGPALIWMDRRAVREAQAFARAADPDRVFERTGLNVDASHAAPKVMWLRAHRPDDMRAASFVGSLASFLTAWLTGEVVHDLAQASSTLLMDVRTGSWDTGLAELAGLELERLPGIRPADTAAGTLRAPVAEVLGLTTRCEVLAGTGDDHASHLGGGGMAPGAVVDVVGTAEPVGARVEGAILDPDRLLETHRHAIRDQYLVQHPGFASGGAIRWLAGLLGVGQARVLELCEQSPPGARGVRFVPSLSGALVPRWNPEVDAVFAGLSFATGPADLARAVVEGVCFALRDVVDRMRELGVGHHVRVVGGGSRSRGWLAMKSAVLDAPLAVARVPDAAVVGAAMLAGMAGGEFGSVEEASDRLVGVVEHAVEPDPALVACYRDAHADYRRLFESAEAYGTPRRGERA
ncbi:xylulokinase [Microbacterium immunditiarum]|uniref:Xylulokinase n=1 Tax=Microbacterium immunditiarum TaxID=337480 RepID=A0A7Y9GM96_9MICO|nr:FGGY family carbohydrate kinase [Microbacterium immunditiarum]NYE19032.1 xylulokinase [Microbacterium immunditiarum]